MSGGQGSIASHAWGWEDLTTVTHPKRVAGVMAVFNSSGGSTGKGKEAEFTGCSKGSSKVQLESGRSLTQGSKELVALPSLEVLENLLGRTLDIMV